VRLTCAIIQQSPQSGGRRQSDQRASNHLEEAMRELCAGARRSRSVRKMAAAYLMQQQQPLQLAAQQRVEPSAADGARPGS
jgi:hypothetical protein